MVLFDPERRWITRAACNWNDDRKVFFPKSAPPGKRASHATQRAWDQAKEICAMCPVLAECKRDTLGEEWGVWGGLDQNQRAAVRRRLSRAAKGWPTERRLAWGKELARLRAGGIAWADIRLQSGVGPVLGEELVAEWDAHQAALNARPKVVDLPLPDGPPRAKGPVFPDTPGRRHAWVRHNGRMADAIYRGQTANGVWVFVTVYSGHGHVNKWVRAYNVRMYHPQPVVILVKKRGSDEPAPAEYDPAA